MCDVDGGGGGQWKTRRSTRTDGRGWGLARACWRTVLPRNPGRKLSASVTGYRWRKPLRVEEIHSWLLLWCTAASLLVSSPLWLRYNCRESLLSTFIAICCSGNCNCKLHCCYTWRVSRLRGMELHFLRLSSSVRACISPLFWPFPFVPLSGSVCGCVCVCLCVAVCLSLSTPKDCISELLNLRGSIQESSWPYSTSQVHLG